jgi:hypothetical protein
MKALVLAVFALFGLSQFVGTKLGFKLPSDPLTCSNPQVKKSSMQTKLLANFNPHFNSINQDFRACEHVGGHGSG